MRISNATEEISIRVLLIEDIDFYNFEEEFQQFLEQNPDFLRLPLYIKFSQNVEISIPELSIFIDSLKDMRVFISGIITESKGTQRFATQLAIPSFNALEFVRTEKTLSTVQDYHKQQESVIATPQLSARDKQLLNSPQPEKTAEYQQAYQPMNDVYSGDTKPSQTHSSPHQERQTMATNTPPQPRSPAPSVPQAPVPQPPVSQAPSPVASPHVAPQAASSPKPVVTINPYENNGLTQPDKSPIIVKENVTAGQNIKYDGDVIVLGEVSSGAVVSATGSIHCYNRADGVLLAGSSGNTKARIYTLRLNAEAVALSGFYAKRHQYKHIVNQTNLMISLNKSDLNFNVIQKMPSTGNLTAISSQEYTQPQPAPKILQEAAPEPMPSMPSNTSLNTPSNMASTASPPVNSNAFASNANREARAPNLYDDGYSSSVLKSLNELEEPSLSAMENEAHLLPSLENPEHLESSAPSPRLSPQRVSRKNDNIVPPLATLGT